MKKLVKGIVIVSMTLMIISNVVASQSLHGDDKVWYDYGIQI